MTDLEIIFLVMTFVVPTMCIFADDLKWKRGGK